MVKFLIIRFSSIGDIVLTTPVIRNLKQQVEDSEIHFLTKSKFKGVVENNPYIDKLHCLEKGNFKQLIRNLKNEDIDYIIDLHNNLRTIRFKRKLKRLPFTFDKLNWKKFLLVNFKINKMPDIHIVERYMDTTKLFDVVNDNKGLDYFIPEKDEVELSTLPDSFHNGYIAFVIGATYFTKRYPVEKVIEICNKTDKPILLIGGPTDKEFGNKVLEGVTDKNRIINTCGEYNLNKSASLVKQSNVVLTNDTGLMHIAAAFKKKIISFWGNTVPELGMTPYQSAPESTIFETKGLKCRPCSKLGYHKCPKKHFKCMNDISVKEVINTIERVY